MVDKCINEIRSSVAVACAKFEYKRVKVAVTEAELETFDEESKIQYYRNRNFQLPDVATYLESHTNLTRKTVVQILLGLRDKLEALSKDIDGNAIANPAKFVKADSYNTFSTHLEE
ncbi:hypothetical protein [Vibrio parahaemolyticus]|uniref:hypothetical protein n=1 Tax=Vibrio parahaemolyticus TaxID=670 RepID=UPI00387B855D